MKKNLNERTLEELQNDCKYLIEEHHLETYTDYADMCGYMRSVCALIQKDEQRATELDAVERENLKNLEVLLDVCASMFVNCDPYYRR